MILSLLFFSLAAVCNALCDNLQHHWYKSIFNNPKRNLKWWNGELSWLNKYQDGQVAKGFVKWNAWGVRFTKPVCFTDAWHFFKSLMVVLLALSGVTLYGNRMDLSLVGYLIILCLYGIVWIGTFNLFYNRILNKF